MNSFKRDKLYYIILHKNAIETNIIKIITNYLNSDILFYLLTN